MLTPAPMKRHSSLTLFIVTALSAATACSSDGGKHLEPATTYLVRDLGEGRCVTMNTGGTILGIDGDNKPFTTNAEGERKELSTPTGTTVTVPIAIGESGEIVGYAQGDEGRAAVRYGNGKWTTIKDLGTNSAAAGIGAGGEVVGYSVDDDGMHAFVLKNDKLTKLPLDKNLSSVAYAVGANGDILGIMETEAHETHAFRIADGKLHDLGTLGGKRSAPLGINTKGDIVGTSELADTTMRAFILPAGEETLVDLGVPTGGVTADARGIDDFGRVGINVTWADGSTHTYVAAVGSEALEVMPRDKNKTPYVSAHISSVLADGRMVGWGAPKGSVDGAIHCLLWTPPAAEEAK